MFGNDKRPPAAALASGLVALLALAGCAGRMAPSEAHAVHPSPKSSVPVPTAQPAATLKPDALDAPAATSVADAQRSAEIAEEMSGAAGGSHEGHGGGHEGHGGHGGHGGGTYVHVDAGRAAAAQEETQEMPHDHHAHGHGMAEAAEEEATEVYACPMHPEVTSKEPGKCPKCGMELVQRRKE
jgi:hypothetical protein